MRNGGENIQEYKGPREAAGIADYLKKQLGPASTVIKSVEDAAGVVDEKKISIVSHFVFVYQKNQSFFSQLNLSNSWDVIYISRLDCFQNSLGKNMKTSWL